MLATDRQALICDMAETYRIYDLGALPARLVASLACGLRANSRIILKMSGAKAPLETLLMALIADELGVLCWQNTEDGHKNRNRPKSVYESIMKDEPKPTGFSTGAEFDAWREKILSSKEG